MKTLRSVAAIFLVAALLPAYHSATPGIAAENLGLKAPAGFEVTQFAGDDLAHDIFSLSTDAKGRIVVSGPGYVKILHDDNADGVADRATLFSRKPGSGAQGMYFDGTTLHCTGDGGLIRLLDSDGDGTADDQSESPPRGGSEHGLHAVLRGPDGWFYVMCGNDSKISSKHAAPITSPVRDPRAGAVLRFSSAGRSTEVFADEFRNPYDMDFTGLGTLVTVDSDNERDHHLPWYTPTRLLDIAQGRGHGWIQQGWQKAWNRPAAFIDGAPRLAELGRGSPTGLLVYRHRAFPERYRGGVFSGCWTLGKIYHLPLTPQGSSYTSQVETFLESTGETGFAPVDMAVHPSGDIYVAVGGRQTRGGVFRIHYRGEPVAALTGQPLDQVLSADQPLSSWSRDRWVPMAETLGKEPFERAVLDEKRSDAERIRAVEVLTELFGGVSRELAAKAVAADRPAVVARVVWSLGRSDDTLDTVDLLAKLTRHADARVLRAVWETIAAMSAYRQPPPDIELINRIHAGLDFHHAAGHVDRHVRAAMLTAARSGALNALPNPPAGKALPVHQLADFWLRSDEWSPSDFEGCAALLPNLPTPQFQLDALRAMHRGMGDLKLLEIEPQLFNGYAPQRPDAVPPATAKQIAAQLAELFPVATARGNEEPSRSLNRELARMLALLAAPSKQALDKLATRWSNRSDPVDDLHYLIVAARIPGPRSAGFTKGAAKALAAIPAKMDRLKFLPSRNWPLRVGELFAELIKHDPALAKAIADDAGFRLPEHAIYLQRFPRDSKEYAAKKLLAAIRRQPDVSWTPELIDAFKVLPRADLLPLLREQWEEAALRDKIAEVLAEKPSEIDRPRFVQTIASVQPQAVSAVAKALSQLKSPGSPSEIRLALQALRNLPVGGDQRAARESLATLLRHWSGQNIETVEPEPVRDLAAQSAAITAAYQPWYDWFRQAHPIEAKQLGVSGNLDWSAWEERLAKVNWDAGDVARGQKVFELKACQRCHAGSGRLGPDLAGVGLRFSRNDLIAAIVDPNKDVAPLYQTKTVVTGEGAIHHGLVIYESPDSVLLQTTPDTVLRLTGIEPGGIRPSRQSLMPTGLLNDVTDAQLADLYAFLKTLKK